MKGTYEAGVGSVCRTGWGILNRQNIGNVGGSQPWSVPAKSREIESIGSISNAELA